MFVAMGLSAVFPVLQGIKLYGVMEAQQRIGLSWMLLQGLLYIAGAGLYAVSCHYAPKKSIPNIDRHVGQRESLQGRLISGEAHIKYSIC
jgi:predicted membrane channel-forming protein YqfA (hemolysin III family)